MHLDLDAEPIKLPEQVHFSDEMDESDIAVFTEHAQYDYLEHLKDQINQKFIKGACDVSYTGTFMVSRDATLVDFTGVSY